MYVCDACLDEHSERQALCINCWSRKGKLCIACGTAKALRSSACKSLCEACSRARLMNQCQYCQAVNFEEELVGQPPHFNLCCQNAKLRHLEPLHHPPKELQNLLQNRPFLDQIRYYNGAFSCLLRH